MAVDIDINLDAEGVQSRINGIAGSLEALQRAADDLDIDADADFSEITDEIAEAMDALGDIDFDKKLDGIAQSLSQAADDLEDALNAEIEVSHVDAETNDGESSGDDPPRDRSPKVSEISGLNNILEEMLEGPVAGEMSSSFDEEKFKANLASASGFNEDQFKILGDYDQDQLKEISKKLDTTTQRLTSEEYDHISAPQEANFGPGDNFHTEEKDFSSMDWQQVQQHASDAGVYTQNADRETLERRLRSQLQRDGLEIRVDTEKLGKVSLKQAMDRNPDINAPETGGGFGDFNNNDPLVELLADSLAEAKLDALKNTQSFGLGRDGLHQFDDAGLNDDIRRSELSDGELLDIYNEDRGGMPEGDFRPPIPDMDTPDTDMREVYDGEMDTDFFKAFQKDDHSQVFKGFGSRLDGLKPTMGKYMQVLAALIPIAVALAPALLGVASAMGAVAGAGVAMIGIGLIGHAESMSGAFASAEERVRGLKRQIFQTIQPTARLFAPIQAEAFERIPGAIRPISEELQKLTSFKDTVFAAGGSLSSGLQSFISLIASNEDKITQLTLRFLELTQVGILNFFRFLFNEAYRSQDLFIKVGRVLKSLIVTFFNVSKAIARVLSTLGPVIRLFAGFSSLLNNKIVVAILGFVSVAYLTIGVLSKLGLAAYGAFSALGMFGSAGFIGSMIAGLTTVMAHVTALIMELTALQFQAATTAAALALTGVGAIAVGAGALAAGSIMAGNDGIREGGPGAGGFPREGDTINNEYNFTNYGDMDSASEERFRTEFSRLEGENKAMQAPDPEVGSSSSTTSGPSA
jgi:hypothetical protein